MNNVLKVVWVVMETVINVAMNVTIVSIFLKINVIWNVLLFKCMCCHKRKTVCFATNLACFVTGLYKRNAMAANSLMLCNRDLNLIQLWIRIKTWQSHLVPVFLFVKITIIMIFYRITVYFAIYFRIQDAKNVPFLVFNFLKALYV